MEDDVLELLARSRPRPVSDDPAVSASTRELVRSAARTARRRSRRSERAGFFVGIAIVAAACAAVIPVVTSQPSGMVDAIATEEPGPAEGPSVELPEGRDGGDSQEEAEASAEPDSGSGCRILSRIVPDPATADENLAENLETARAFLAEEDLESLPLEAVAASSPFSPEAHTAVEVENKALTEIESALGEAGLLQPGISVETTLTCTEPGAP
jgi:hypothetical protein